VYSARPFYLIFENNRKQKFLFGLLVVCKNGKHTAPLHTDNRDTSNDNINYHEGILSCISTLFSWIPFHVLSSSSLSLLFEDHLCPFCLDFLKLKTNFFTSKRDDYISKRNVYEFRRHLYRYLRELQQVDSLSPLS